MRSSQLGARTLRGRPALAVQCRNFSTLRQLSITHSSKGRHPDLTTDIKHAGDQPRPNVESDSRYIRNDDSVVLAHHARQGYARAIQGGEPKMRLAEAALWASAEDDAISSHSTVPFPVHSYLARISTITNHVRQQLEIQKLLPSQRAAAVSMQGKATKAASAGLGPIDPEEVLAVVEKALFDAPQFRKARPGQDKQDTKPTITSLQFRVPSYGRSNLPNRVSVDHAGTWEDAKTAYLHEALIRRTAHPAALAIIYAQVMSELFAEGSVEFAVSMDVGDYDDPPLGVPLLNINRSMIQKKSTFSLNPLQKLMQNRPPATTTETKEKEAAEKVNADQGFNTCSSDVVAELQRHLKRSYWCWEWDGRVDAYDDDGVNSLGGFRAAAKAALGEEMNAAITAISAVAAWRLERGVWTSPGAGDLRRALAATERLVMLRGGADQCPEERRDLAVLLIHCGDLSGAKAELGAYMATNAFLQKADPFDKVLCQRIMQLLHTVKDLPSVKPLTVERVLAAPEPKDKAIKPLTW